MERSQSLIILGVTVAHALSHAFILAIPILLPFIREDLNLSYNEMGLLSGILLVTYGLTTFPSGWLADRFGIKSVIFVYLIILAIGSIALIFVNSFSSLLLLAGLIGLVAGFYHPPGLSLISLSFAQEDLGKMFGVHGISGNIGSAIAPSLAVFVASTKYGWKYALLPLGVFSLLAIPIFLAITIPNPKNTESGLSPEPQQAPKSQHNNDKLKKILIQPLIVILLVSMLVGLIDRGMIAFLAVYLVDDRNYSAVLAGLIVSATFVIAIIGQIAFGILSDTKGAVNAFRLATLALVILFILIPFAPGYLLIIVLCITTFVITGTQPPLSILTTSVSSQEKRGTVFGLQFISVFGVGGLAGFLVGIIASNFGLDAIYFILSGFGAIALLFLLFYPKHPDLTST